MLIQEHPQLVRAPEDQIARLTNNLSLLKEFKDSEDEQRRISEEAGGGDDIELHNRALTDIRRLRVSVEADAEKESEIYRELLEESRRVGA